MIAELFVHYFVKRTVFWNLIVAKYRADARALEDVAEVAGEAVGDIDRGAREPAQPLAERDARFGLVQALRRAGEPGMRKFERGAAERARDPYVIARARAGARQRLARRDLAERRDVDRQGTARGVAADELDAVTVREGEQAVGEALQPGLVRRGQRERERDPARRGAGRGEVGEIHGERLVAERARLGARREVPAFDEHVGGDRELRAFAHADAGAVVAYSLYGASCRPGEEAADDLKFADLKFTQARFLDLANSSGRSAAAIFSSTPLTKRWPSVPPKLLPSSTASFSTTLNGVPGWAESS